MKRITRFIPEIMILCMLFLSCADENMARVTLHIERNDLASVFEREHPVMALVDKFMRLFTRDAFASFPTWDSTHGDLSLIISSHDINYIMISVPPGSTEISILAPAGEDRKFTVYSTSSGYKNWGGETTLNLKAGEQTNASVIMIPMTPITSLSYATGVIINFEQVDDTYCNNYKAYRSTTEQGPYIKVAESTDSYVSSITDGTAASGTTYFYKVQVYNNDGNGLLSDAKSTTTP